MNEFALGFSVAALARGVAITLIVTLGASVVAIVLGLIVGLMRVSPRWPLRWFGIAYIEFLRGTSMLVQLYWWFFVLPIFGVALSPWTVAIFGIGMSVSSYGAELVRAALQAVDRSQYEASIALNFSWLSMMRRIVLPQAIRAMLPAWGTLLIELLKGTSLIFFITITELTTASKLAADATGNYLLFFAVALFGYYVIARALITPFVRWLERRFSRGFVREALA
ncbi:MAG: ectoine/hydroxyectoine ABC transporter permease subunit EhuC [Mesorhizobium sp.]|uniref:ectoine/hydroxyectoine ABC transporter permease subunit EhuC n=1 Tax=unclassified Mesorhizobium TaxID=325217 RepID=UPI000FCAFB8A|nr:MULTISPECIES: ectoine/hydroxyectoine ABC transporter permease subunit EhuC [unclassified Mesorhizobium]AZV19387.1 ectoine/hydroxyectoine ABC transporter permease subunit EhuC [Mesorhizobium sp. M7A.F.Ce.TU.012.03.2.1]MDF3156711.1 ectoine/hydroxyectoine ABC transporter permease subunit EhuC [Mesorhizobium sp. XAP10]MDF3249598.1 ectoine/hydroxyectoine ABC transporter permease subunit EhuC [Mesorhizobium sp. XAP4]RUV34060.1 ectoine/hydroxyectoine ABC transporter permease subunit EhuC [Mesorhizo